jgi:hypothetical protein
MGDFRLCETAIIGERHRHRRVVRAGLERDAVVLQQRLVDQRRQSIHLPDRRFRAELAVREERGEVLLVGQPHLIAVELHLQLVQIDLVRGRQGAEDEFAVDLDDDRLDHHPSRNVFGGGEILGRVSDRVVGQVVADPHFVQVTLQVHKDLLFERLSRLCRTNPL